MEISIVKSSVYRKYLENIKIYPSRRAAFRAAKRDGNIPMMAHPDDVILPFTKDGDTFELDDRNVRLYVFNFWLGVIMVQYFIREDKEAFYGSGDQLPHFNSGKSSDDKLKKHHYWNNDKDCKKR